MDNLPNNLDSKQKQVLNRCREIIAARHSKSLFLKFFKKNSAKSGIYLHGDVGRGKTMLMKLLYEEINAPKKLIHFQQFMQDLHKRSHSLQKKSADKLIEKLAAELASQAQFIFMDEFEIKDITDAMLIMHLFEYLSRNGVFIFVTTNTIPDNLYKDGLQRDAFLPFIDRINKEFEVLHLDSQTDYRFEAISAITRRILFPKSEGTAREMKRIKSELCDDAETAPAEIEVFGRNIAFKKVHQNILFTNFDELFLRDLGYADYVNICSHFQIIVLESVRPIAEDETDVATRFINFIDNAYFQRVMLFAEIQCKPSLIYPKGKKLAEFQRTISRLNEMNSKDYGVSDEQS